MMIGITGAPSKGKSTFFSASTMVDVEISPRPFTTVVPNKGSTLIRFPCVETELHVKCTPKNSKCVDGIRYVPISVVDLAGLVPGAHEGKGLGNKFLDDVRRADVLIQIIDVSGMTDLEGNPTEGADPAAEITFLEEEIDAWFFNIAKKAVKQAIRKDIDAMYDGLTGLNITPTLIDRTADKFSLAKQRISWTDEEIMKFASELRKESLPIVIAANKIDLPGARENFDKLVKEFPDKLIIPTYADGELALRMAADKNLIDYQPGSTEFKILDVTENQKKALEQMSKVMKSNEGTGVQKTINSAVFDKLGLIIVYPVNDENKFTDHFGNILPDAVFVRKGTTALGFAGKIHTDLGKNFIHAVDCKTKRRIAKDHVLKDGDVIKIVAGK